jgi:hypothetical protein
MELLEATMEQEKVSVDMSTLDSEDIERFKALFTSVGLFHLFYLFSSASLTPFDCRCGSKWRDLK